MSRLGVVCLVLGAAGLLASSLLPAAAPPQSKSARFDDVTCNTISCNAIELISKDGKHRVNVYAQDECVGVIVSGPEGYAQLFAGNGQGAWLGVDATSQQLRGTAFAVCSGERATGVAPYLQLIDNKGTWKFASVKDIMKLLEKEK